MPADRPFRLPLVPDVPQALLRQIRQDHDRFAQTGLPEDLDAYLQEAYGLDMAASYAGRTLRNPWGKASGQLTLNRAQIEEAAQAQLGLAVLKTVIAQDSQGHQSMSAWAIKESHMIAEPIASQKTGATGWTITWKGRGWWQSFPEYLDLIRASCAVARSHNLLVVPSVKYHLPAPGEVSWRVEEYIETTRSLKGAYESAGGQLPMPLEKDFSPTLAGSDRAKQRAMVLEWLARVPQLVRSAVPSRDELHLGLKLFNCVDDDAFQLAMLAQVHNQSDRPEFLVYANRLFDPNRVFEGKTGVAYGGPDLSDRNLRLLSQLRVAQRRGEIDRPDLEISGTGDISSGRLAVEYALCGCTSFQIHTLFQLPTSEYAQRVGTKVQRALHRLYFDPADGFLVWAFHAARRLDLIASGKMRFLDLARRGAQSTPEDDRAVL
jgi:hypothetical protein